MNPFLLSLPVGNEPHYSRYLSFISERLIHRQNSESDQISYDRHHINPFIKDTPEDCPENLIKLTPREHMFAHKMLHLAYGGKMSSAYFWMTKLVKRYSTKLTSKEYDRLRLANIEHTKSFERRQRQSRTMTGRKHSEETKRKIGEASKGNNNPNFGKKHSEEMILKLQLIARKRVKKVPPPIASNKIPIYCYELDVIFPYIRFCANELNLKDLPDYSRKYKTLEVFKIGDYTLVKLNRKPEKDGYIIPNKEVLL